MQPDHLVTVADFQEASRHAISEPAWDYITGGSGDEITVRANTSVFEERRILPRMLRETSSIDTRTTILGAESGKPFAIAPMALQRLFHPEGEIATARAAARNDIPFSLATLSSIEMAKVVEHGGQFFFQLYWLRDRGLMAEMLAGAETFGCRAVILTVDAPPLGHRLRDVRNGFRLPDDVYPANIVSEDDEAAESLRDSVDLTFDTSLNWDDLEWIKEHCSLPLVIKGLLHPDDARAAVEHGADGIVVSNHGGRQLDQAVTSLEVLPLIREAVGPDLELVLDSGVRSGRDVLLALARGADSVFIGRPALWGLAVAGADGVSQVLGILEAELLDAMSLSGTRTIAEAKELAVW